MKNDYSKDYFWVKEDGLGDKHYYFKTDDGLLEVDKEVYSVCFCSYLKIRRDLKKDLNANLLSYDYINNDGHTLLDVIGKNIDYEKEVLISQVLDEIKSLNHDEQMLIKSLYIDGKTLRELSVELKVPVMTLQNRKNKILDKLKKRIV